MLYVVSVVAMVTYHVFLVVQWLPVHPRSGWSLRCVVDGLRVFSRPALQLPSPPHPPLPQHSLMAASLILDLSSKVQRSSLLSQSGGLDNEVCSNILDDPMVITCVCERVRACVHVHTYANITPFI